MIFSVRKEIGSPNAYSARSHTFCPGMVTRQCATFLCTVCFIAVRFAQLDKRRSAEEEAALNNRGESAAPGFAQS